MGPFYAIWISIFFTISIFGIAFYLQRLHIQKRTTLSVGWSQNQIYIVFIWSKSSITAKTCNQKKYGTRTFLRHAFLPHIFLNAISAIRTILWQFIEPKDLRIANMPVMQKNYVAGRPMLQKNHVKDRSLLQLDSCRRKVCCRKVVVPKLYPQITACYGFL